MYTATLRRSRCLKVVLVALAALLVALVGTEPRQAEAVDAPHYTITDLGAIPDNTDSEATAINTSGQVVGRLSNGPAPSPMAFLYENGVMTKLGLLPGASGSEAYGINDNAQIVGSADVGVAKRAFLYENGTTTNLGTLPNPGTSGGSEAFDINTSGQVVGYSATLEGSTDSQPDEHAFIYEGGSMKDLGTFASDYPSRALAINNMGQIVGSADLPTTGDSTAFLYDNGAMTDLGARMGAHVSRAQDINDSHQIVGGAKLSSDPEAPPHAFLYDTDGTVSDLSTLPRHGLSAGFSEAYALNCSGQVVGVSAMSSRLIDPRAFLYSGGAMTDLNDLISADSGWDLWVAEDINDSGRIVGVGRNPNDQQHAFLLRPAYNFSGFYQPVDNCPTLNVVRQPAGTANQLLRFSLGTDQGTDIFENGYPSSTRVACPSESSTDVVEDTAPAEASNLKYNGNGQYTYSWKTEKAWKGTCRELNLKLKDGTEHTALFQFTK
jgi:probable HAF family extracellular repeat protein